MKNNVNKSAKNIVILGLGETGFSCCEYFAQKNIPFTVVDTRLAPPHLNEFKKRFPNYPLYTGGFHREILNAAETIVLSPGIASDHPELKNLNPGIEMIGDIELFARELSASANASASTTSDIVAITGSNGKSTVTTLLGEMAKLAGMSVGVGGNLGKPALDLLDPLIKLYVLELSSFQLETTYSLKPSVATILNLCPDHMDRYSSLQEYFRAKERIYLGAKALVINRDDKEVVNTAPHDVPSISFGLNEPKAGSRDFGILRSSDNKLWLVCGQERLLESIELKIVGKHNLANGLAALALGETLGLSREKMVQALKEFKGLAHRSEWIRTLNGVTYINDSKGTNVGATLAALQGLKNEIPGKWILIAGGVGKNADFSPLTSIIKDCCRAVVLIGEAQLELQALLKDSLGCFLAGSLEEAVELAKKTAEVGDGVLLSPACASFDMFKNFEDRGEAFKAQVLSL